MNRARIGFSGFLALLLAIGILVILFQETIKKQSEYVVAPEKEGYIISDQEEYIQPDGTKFFARMYESPNIKYYQAKDGSILKRSEDGSVFTRATYIEIDGVPTIKSSGVEYRSLSPREQLNNWITGSKSVITEKELELLERYNETNKGEIKNARDNKTQ